MKNVLVLAAFVITVSPVSVIAAPRTLPQSATVSMVLDHCRMTVGVQIVRSDGSMRRARAWIDSGGTAVVVAETLARDLGVDLTKMPASGEHSLETKSPVPAIHLGGIPLDTKDMFLSVHSGRFARPGVQAECTLPARCFRKLHVVFDYPSRRLTLASPGILKPRGTPVPIRVNPDTGLFMVETEIEGGKVPLGVDNGSAGTWVSQKLIAAWLARHADWTHAVGAAGSTNFFGFPFETKGTLLHLSILTVGPIPVKDIAVLGLDQGLFDWYSRKSAAPVAGFLGAEVITRFRLEVDFPGQKSWWQLSPPRAIRDLDIVGLTLHADADGSFSVAGVLSRSGQPAVPGVQTGDKLIRVGNLNTTNAPMGTVINALRGKPGDFRRLLIERAGRRFTILASVARFP